MPGAPLAALADLGVCETAKVNGRHSHAQGDDPDGVREIGGCPGLMRQTLQVSDANRLTAGERNGLAECRRNSRREPLRQ
jgi:hypothetical protein